MFPGFYFWNISLDETANFQHSSTYVVKVSVLHWSNSISNKSTTKQLRPLQKWLISACWTPLIERDPHVLKDLKVIWSGKWPHVTRCRAQMPFRGQKSKDSENKDSMLLECNPPIVSRRCLCPVTFFWNLKRRHGTNDLKYTWGKRWKYKKQSLLSK